MIIIKFLVFVQVASFFGSILCQDTRQRVFIKSVDCNVSEKYIHSNYSCFAKTNRRTGVSLVNIRGTAKLPLRNFYLVAKLFYMIGPIHKEIVHTPRLFWCEVMDAQVQTNMIEALEQLVDGNLSTLLHVCPYQEIKIKNFALKPHFILSYIPIGDFQIAFNLYHENDDFIAQADITASVGL